MADPVSSAAPAADAERPPELVAGVEPLEVFVELLAELDTDTSATDFYDRICEAICRLTTMQRAAIFMADLPRRRAVVIGAHGTSFRDLALPESMRATPFVQQSLVRDEVVVVPEIAGQGLREYAERFGITTLVCTPLAAAGHAYGVILADRGGGSFVVGEGERHLLWTLGKTAALVATARNATRSQERNRRLSERIALAREIHERVVQRLFGVSLALSARTPLDAEARERCSVEMQQALGDLREALERPLAPLSGRVPSTRTLAAEIARMTDGGTADAPGPPVSVDWPDGVQAPQWAEPLAQSVLAEALRNVAKHARASAIEVVVREEADTFSLEIRNDGVGAGARGAGMGLRLAAFEALQHGGVVDFGAPAPGRWRVRLVVPRREGGDGL